MPQSWIRALHANRYRTSGHLKQSLSNSLNSARRFLETSDILNSSQCRDDKGYLSAVSNGFSTKTALFMTTKSTTLKQYCRSTTYLRRCSTHSGVCELAGTGSCLLVSDKNNFVAEDAILDLDTCDESSAVGASDDVTVNRGPTVGKEHKRKHTHKKSVVDFSAIEPHMLPSVILVGRPNVGKSALFNRLIRRREALVCNTPDDHVTRDIREGIAKLGDLRFRVLDSAGLEMAATSGSILDRSADMTGKVLANTQFAVFLIDVRDGLHPMDLEVGKWLRKHASGITTILVMNKSESLDDHRGYLTSAAGDAHKLGYGDPIAISAETGLGMVDLYEALLPLLEKYMLQTIDNNACEGNISSEVEESKLPLQLAIVGRPNVGKSTLLNALLQQERVMVGPEVGLTRDSVRAEFQFHGRTIYLVDTAGWLQRSNGLLGLSVMQSRKSLMRAHVIALVLDGEEIAKARSSMTHAEVVIARRAVEEGRSLIVIVNKMDLLRGENKLYEKVIKAVPEEIQTVIPQITGIPVVFVSALEGKGRLRVMHQVVNAYEKWCLRLSTARLNRWLQKVMSRHSWKEEASKPKIKYFTQVKARPPTFVAFISGKKELIETDIRFLTKSLKEDFDLGGIPIRVMQRCLARKQNNTQNIKKMKKPVSKSLDRLPSEKRTG